MTTPNEPAKTLSVTSDDLNARFAVTELTLVFLIEHLGKTNEITNDLESFIAHLSEHKYEEKEAFRNRLAKYAAYMKRLIET